ncbi:MAG: hypothetical protein K2J32_07615 [Ruminococcus sp.]|nr:hypothetical protein [Ruminococcus sp.]
MDFTRLDEKSLKRLAEFLSEKKQNCELFSVGAGFEDGKVFVMRLDYYLGLGHDCNDCKLAVITENEIFMVLAEESGIGDLFRVVGIETEYGIIEPTEYQSKFYKYIEQSGKILDIYSEIYFDNEENEKYEKEMRLKYGIK